LHPLADADKAQYFSYNTIIDHGHAILFEGLTLDYSNWYMQIAISIMITLISLQAEIFNSEGYKKFVTQTDGSMDLLVKLAKQKQESLTFVYNNLKI
jgi:hypothetical protein